MITKEPTYTAAEFARSLVGAAINENLPSASADLADLANIVAEDRERGHVLVALARFAARSIDAEARCRAPEDAAGRASLVARIFAVDAALVS